jgi:RNA polymerase sigma-70 factor (ECF subfamily)
MDVKEQFGKRREFPRTDWSQLASLGGTSERDDLDLLNHLAARYWSPLYQFVLAQGHNEVEAMDLVQEFFAFALQTQLFRKADRSKGRFRSFLLGALTNFLHKDHRRQAAQKRKPPGGFASLEALAADVYFQPPSLIERQTPETLFHQVWVRGVIAAVLRALEQECRATGKETHFRLFQARVVGPELRGEISPSLESLARELGLDYKDAANRLGTAKRAFARLLIAEVRAYAGSADDAACERDEVLALLQLGH